MAMKLKKTFMEDHPEWYGTYSDYHQEIVKQKIPQEFEEEVEQLRAKLDKLEKRIQNKVIFFQASVV